MQTAANSSLGRQVIGIAKRFGIKTINVVRKSQHVKELKDLGCAPTQKPAEPDLALNVPPRSWPCFGPSFTHPALTTA